MPRGQVRGLAVGHRALFRTPHGIHEKREPAPSHVTAGPKSDSPEKTRMAISQLTEILRPHLCCFLPASLRVRGEEGSRGAAA